MGPIPSIRSRDDEVRRDEVMVVVNGMADVTEVLAGTVLSVPPSLVAVGPFCPPQPAEARVRTRSPTAKDNFVLIGAMVAPSAHRRIAGR